MIYVGLLALKNYKLQLPNSICNPVYWIILLPNFIHLNIVIFFFQLEKFPLLAHNEWRK